MHLVIILVLFFIIVVIMTFTNFTFEYLGLGTPHTVDAEDLPMGYRMGRKFYCPIEYHKLEGPHGKLYLGNQLTEFRAWYCENVTANRSINKTPKLLHVYFGDMRTERLVLRMIRETDYIFSLNPSKLKSITISGRLIDELSDMES